MIDLIRNLAFCFKEYNQVFMILVFLDVLFNKVMTIFTFIIIGFRFQYYEKTLSFKKSLTKCDEIYKLRNFICDQHNFSKK